jgi:hypothetical protein
MMVVEGMKHQNSKILSFVWILLTITLFSVWIPPCQANFADWNYIQEGSTFHNGTHISMPFADVDINITRRVATVSTSLSSEYHIYTNTTQNTTLAFVFPSVIHGMSGSNFPTTNNNSEITIGTSFMQIKVNGSIINYTLVLWDDFVTSNYSVDFWTVAQYPEPLVDFAVFDLELLSNTTQVLTVTTSAEYELNVDLFEYYYFVSSARTFEGNTHERIHMRLTEESQFLSKNFYPSESLSVTENGLVSDAVWEFNVREFSQDAVTLRAIVRDSSLIGIEPIITAGAIALVVLLVYQFGYKKSKQSSH